MLTDSKGLTAPSRRLLPLVVGRVMLTKRFSAPSLERRATATRAIRSFVRACLFSVTTGRAMSFEWCLGAPARFRPLFGGVAGPRRV